MKYIKTMEQRGLFQLIQLLDPFAIKTSRALVRMFGLTIYMLDHDDDYDTRTAVAADAPGCSAACSAAAATVRAATA